MKKLFILISMLLLLGCGCNSKNKEQIKKDFGKKINSLNSYKIEGTLEIINNEETFKYDVSVLYKKDDLYKVVLINKTNNHKQLILKNDNGVYVITPSLNKSFKFQSEWPNNSSQSYILNSLLSDIENNKNYKVSKNRKNIVFNTTANYPNNRNLDKEVITLNKNYNLKKVEVLNKEGITTIKFVVKNFEKNKNVEKKEFYLKNNIEVNKEETQKQTSETFDEVIYPMYLPDNTKFKGEEKVSINGTERTILTFSGEKSFTLVEEPSITSKTFQVEPVYGDIAFIDSALGSLTSTSLTWSNSGIDYYLVGDNLNQEELVTIASSTTVSSTNK